MAPDDTKSDGQTDPVRRRLLSALGAAGVAGLAGCPGGGGNGNGNGNGNGGTQTTRDLQTATETDPLDIKEGGTLSVALTANPSSFDPPYSSGVPASLAQNFFYESLIDQDAQGNIYPWVAESYELAEVNEVSAPDYADYMVEVPVATTEDGTPFLDTEKQVVLQHPEDEVAEGNMVRALTVDETQAAVDDGTFGMQFTYQIHEGVTFTNGEELTSQNVVDSYERIENSQISAQVFNSFLHAEADGDYTVHLYAQEPDAEAERLLPQTIFPSEHLDVEGGQLDPRTGGIEPIGSGPWEFESFEDAESFVVTRRDDYWLEEVGLENKSWWDGPEEFPASPVIDRVEMDIVSEDATRAGALQEKEVDLTYGLTPEAKNNFQDSGDFRVKAVQEGSYLFMQYPVQVEPWDNKQVRQAANYLIPRQQIADQIEQGWASPAWTPLPNLARASGTNDYDALRSDLKPKNEYKPQEAASLIEDAGVETPIEVQIETNSGNTTRVRKVEVIAQAMNQATDSDGNPLFDVQIETFEFGDFVGRILSEDYYTKGNIFVVGLSGTFNPGSFCTATHHSRNWAQCCNGQRISYSDLDEMMDNARFSEAVLGDQQERASRYDAIWRELVDLCANSYIDIGLSTACHTTDVKGFNSYPFPEALLSYGLFAPTTEQITYIDRA